MRAETETDHVVFTVIESKRVSDLENDNFYFQIKLNNNQIWNVKATLQDLVEMRVSVGTPFDLVEENFIPDNPGYSTFKYQTDDQVFQVEGVAESVNSTWKPDPMENPVIEVQSITWRGRTVGLSFYEVKFSDNSIERVYAWYWIGKMISEGDLFFKIGDNRKLVNVKTGLMIAKVGGNPGNFFSDQSAIRQIPIHWNEQIAHFSE